MFKNLTKLTTFFCQNINIISLIYCLTQEQIMAIGLWMHKKPLSLSLFPVKIQLIEFKTKP